MGRKVIFCCPTITKPFAPFQEALGASIPLIEAAGWEEGSVWEVGCPYISAARSAMLRKALDAKADVIVFLDHDLSWDPQDLLKLIETEGDVVAGTYRFKREPEEYMGSVIPNNDGRPSVRADGCILAHSIPAGFLKITKHAVNVFMKAYPELLYGDRFAPHIDLFNHGAHDFTWYGEDYAFARRWREKCGQIWIVPDLNLTHHSDKPYPGNYHRYWLKASGGSESSSPVPPKLMKVA
jgi:glycosyltransferase involved in cell wall biosynthesis